MEVNVVLAPEHIPGCKNIMADWLSRLQVDRFLREAQGSVELSPEQLEEDMTPRSCKGMLMHF
jgi:hypothetical protein